MPRTLRLQLLGALAIAMVQVAMAQPAPPPPVATTSAPGVAPIAAAAPRPVGPLSSTWSWEFKDLVLAAGVVVTLVLGIWNAVSNHRVNKRSTFVNTVTSQRIKWIEQLRQDVSSYSGLVYHWSYTHLPDEAEKRGLIKEIDRLRHVIRLRLNPAGEHDQHIERLLSEIPRYTEDQGKISELLDELTLTSQRLLKEEWEKVKIETQSGPRSERA